MSSIAEWFQTYRRAVIPPTAPPIQIVESERAFVAGAWALLSFLKHDVTGLPDEEGVGILQRLENECLAFVVATTEAPPPPLILEPANYEVRQADIEALLRKLGRELKGQMPDGWGFALLIASFGQTGVPGEGKEGSVFYLASVDRAGAMAMMQDFIKRGTQ